MWILIKENIPTKNPPPRLSIHWSWPNKTNTATNQLKYANQVMWSQDMAPYGSSDEEDMRVKREFFKNNDRLVNHDRPFGYEPNFVESVKIFWNKEQLVLFPHEFNRMDQRKWDDFVYGPDASHVLFENSVQSEVILDITQESDLKSLYEYALIEGASYSLATLFATGQFHPDMMEHEEPPPIGWYCVNPAYADYFGIDVSQWFPDYYQGEEDG